LSKLKKTISLVVVPRGLELLLKVLPKRTHVTIHGDPPSEGNAVKVVEGLAERHRGTVYWLIGPDVGLDAKGLSSNIRVAPKWSLTGIRSYLTAEAVFFTHGIYGDVLPATGKTFVNLWHGDGVKLTPGSEHPRRSMVPSDYIVGGASVFTLKKASTFRVPAERILVTGNPRIDQFSDPVGEGLWDAIGLDPAMPFVVWMPTLRQSRRREGVSDIAEGEPELTPNAIMRSVVSALSDAGIQVVGKPHQQDVEARSIPKMLNVDNEMLLTNRTSLYAFLGRSAGLISDYSSVWTDYLLLDRPLGFVMPDEDQYKRGRGVYPADVLDWLPGEKLHDQARILGFADEVKNGDGATSSQRDAAAERLGLARPQSATHELLDALDERGVFALSGGLKPRGSSTAPEIYFERR
jgi:CDP-glycerol glycerophosphotransferase (TagB/SpsB family)